MGRQVGLGAAVAELRLRVCVQDLGEDLLLVLVGGVGGVWMLLEGYTGSDAEHGGCGQHAAHVVQLQVPVPLLGHRVGVDGLLAVAGLVEVQTRAGHLSVS